MGFEQLVFFDIFFGVLILLLHCVLFHVCLFVLFKIHSGKIGHLVNS